MAKTLDKGEMAIRHGRKNEGATMQPEQHRPLCGLERIAQGMAGNSAIAFAPKVVITLFKFGLGEARCNAQLRLGNPAGTAPNNEGQEGS